HHIVSDGWSRGVLIRELGRLYAAFSAGRPSPLAAPAVQYADYAVWQREWLKGAVLEQQVGYWKERLAGGAAALGLPAGHGRPAGASCCGGAAGFVVASGAEAGGCGGGA